jgi:hypothetical protein
VIPIPADRCDSEEGARPGPFQMHHRPLRRPKNLPDGRTVASATMVLRGALPVLQNGSYRIRRIGVILRKARARSLPSAPSPVAPPEESAGWAHGPLGYDWSARRPCRCRNEPYRIQRIGVILRKARPGPFQVHHRPLRLPKNLPDGRTVPSATTGWREGPAVAERALSNPADRCHSEEGARPGPFQCTIARCAVRRICRMGARIPSATMGSARGAPVPDGDSSVGATDCRAFRTAPCGAFLRMTAGVRSCLRIRSVALRQGCHRWERYIKLLAESSLDAMQIFSAAIRPPGCDRGRVFVGPAGETPP